MPRPRPQPPIDSIKLLTWLVVLLCTLAMAYGLWELVKWLYIQINRYLL